MQYCDIGNILLNSSTDKNTTHRYGPVYDLVFNSQYLKFNRPLKVLEIGISLFGNGSAGSFPAIPYVEKYVGIDNQEYQGSVVNDKVKLYTGPECNAYTYDMLNRIYEKEGTFDIIIDDGPHTWESQEWFFRNYYALLNTGGVLFCEDIHESNLYYLNKLQKELGLYVLDLRINNNPNGDEIISLRFNN
jgi:hypothetical protein